MTGGTGFIGKVLVRHLAESGYPVRLLIRPSKQSPTLPKSVPVEVAVSTLTDARSLHAAMLDVNIIYHLAGVEWHGAHASLMNADILGTQTISRVASEAGVQRFFYLSHLGADRASAYPVLKAKAIAEENIRRCGVCYTIIRSAIAYGLNDHFTSGLARLLNALPSFFFVPEEGNSLLQPIWVEDLVTSLVWALDNNLTENQTFSVGGPEYLTFSYIVQTVLEQLKLRRRLVHVFPPYLRAMTVLFEDMFPGLPVSVYWLDYLATNRTCSLDTMTRVFNILPSRFNHRLDHLKETNWRASLWRNLLRRPR
ncbi:MAG TPA: NAD(P)H-binding protein [Anaerolineales bacterium]|nr:NAD(P)H-binding protein [Anaerolineales bacterium]